MSFCLEREGSACASRVRVYRISPSPETPSARIVPDTIGLTPVRGTHSGVQGLSNLDMFNRVPREQHVTRLEEIQASESQRVKAQLGGHHIHGRLDRKSHLRITGSPHVAGWHTVGVYRIGINLDVRNTIRPGCLTRTAEVDHGCRFESRVGTAIKHHARLTRHQPAVPRHPGAE
jgi:hypothetical protein